MALCYLSCCCLVHTWLVADLASNSIPGESLSLPCGSAATWPALCFGHGLCHGISYCHSDVERCASGWTRVHACARVHPEAHHTDIAVLHGRGMKPGTAAAHRSFPGEAPVVPQHGGCSALRTHLSPSSTHRQFTGGREFLLFRSARCMPHAITCMPCAVERVCLDQSRLRISCSVHGSG